MKMPAGGPLSAAIVASALAVGKAALPCVRGSGPTLRLRVRFGTVTQRRFLLEREMGLAAPGINQFPSGASSATFQKGERFTGRFRRITDMNPFSLGVARVTLQDGRHVFS
jgi:hypothetical protein